MSDALLPTYEELVDARETLTRIIEGIEGGVFGVLEPECLPPLLVVVSDEDNDSDD